MLKAHLSMSSQKKDPTKKGAVSTRKKRFRPLEPRHLEIILQYVRFCVDGKDVRPTMFHHKCKPYNRKQSTYDLLRKAKKRRVIFRPRLLCLPDIDVEFVEYNGLPRIDLYREKRKDPNVTYMMALTGAFSLICFKYGKRVLQCVKCITPSYPAKIGFKDIDPTKYSKEKLKPMKRPENWSELHWAVYRARNDPQRSSIKVGKELNISCCTVLDRYYEILKDCEIWMPFFPNGYSNYTQYVLTFRTEYENGILEELKKLDRSSYLYKADDTLILVLFFDRHLEIESFLKMEKKGIVHDMRVSNPLHSINVFYEDTW